MTTTASPTTPATRLAVLLFTDIVGSTDLKSRLGSSTYRGMLARHNELFEAGVAEIGDAKVIKHTGDGYFASFPTASAAVRFALRFQARIHVEPWEAEPLRTRLGIHIGEVGLLDMANREDVVGLSADLASRLMSLAVGGQILLTAGAFDDARQFVNAAPEMWAADGVPPLKWMAHGAYLFKGTDTPLEVFEVGIENFSPLKSPADSEKAKRVVPHDQEQTLGWRPAVGIQIPQRPNWILERRLGEGGFGEVWLARHVKMKDARVFKFCFDVERLRSFKRELTLFRLLKDALGSRPDIATLYDVKLDEPPFFLESEYTEGGNLLEWSETQGGIDKVPLETRLEIVAKIADAVAAAHSVGILHKDIKPSNILIAQQPDGSIQPRLADFGIGLLSDRAQLAARNITETGFTIITQNDSSRTGTRMYSPPELLAGNPFTIQGDVYALGILLYQMVVADLKRPLAEGWERDFANELLREEIAAAVDGDPARRTGSATELDLRLRSMDERRLQRESACREQERLRLRARRNRTAIALSMILAALLVTGGTTAGIYIRKLSLANTEVRRQRDEAKRQAENAEASSNFIRKTLQSSDPYQGGKQEWRVNDAMLGAVKALDDGAFKNQPETEAGLRILIAHILADNGLAAQALPQAERAHSIYQDRHPGDHPDVATSLSTIAFCLDSLGRSAEALPKFEAALEMRQRVFKGAHPDVAVGLNNIASCLDSLGRSSEALPKYEAALEMMQRLFKGDHPAAATSLSNVAFCLVSLGRSAEALPKHEAALEMRQRLFKGDHPAVAMSLNNIAFCLDSLGRSAEALPKYKAALEMKERLFEGDHPAVAKSLSNMASCLNSLGRTAEALPKHEAALEMRQRLFKGDHPDVAKSLSNVANCLRQLGRLAEAGERAQAAAAMAGRVLPEGHPIRKDCEATLAIIKAEAATRPVAAQR